MRLSDLKKKSAPPQEPPAPARSEAGPSAPSAPPRPAKPGAPPPLLALDSQRAEARAAYGRALRAVTQVLAAGGQQAAGALAELAAIVDEMIRLLRSGNQVLLTYTQCGTPEDPVCGHSLNVAVIALRLGLGLRCSPEELVSLGLAALLHDLGRQRSYRLALDPGLAASEARSIRSSVADSAKLLDRFGDGEAGLKDSVAGVLSRLHAGGLAGAEARPDKGRLAAQLIALCDLYEALSRGHDGKPPLPPQLAFKTLLDMKDRFAPPLVKRLIEELSPFPPGSLLQLADGRIGIVVRINSKMLTRPLVELWLHSDGTLVEPPTALDLAAEPLIAVHGQADERKVAASAARERLEGYRLWREG